MVETKVKINLENQKVKAELQEVIDSNSKFIPHIKNNIVKNEEECYYSGQQGGSVEFSKGKKVRFHSVTDSELIKERRVYVDIIETINESRQSSEKFSDKLRENKLALLGIRFSKRFDNTFVKEICKGENFNSEALTKSPNAGVRDILKWAIDNTSSMQNINNKYTKGEGHGSFAIDPSDLIFIINQQTMDDIRLREIFGEIKLENYLKELIIVDALLPERFYALLINKRALWYTYEIKGEPNQIYKDYEDKIYLHVSYEMGMFQFAGACALLKE